MRAGGTRRFAAAASAMLVAGWLAPAAAADPPKIASMNVCTDQLLISLADPQQILGLSRYARERFESFSADDAGRFRILSGGAEDILELKPDVVVASLFDKRSTRELLRAKGINLAEFAVPRNLGEVKAQIGQMGELVGHPERAAAQIARLEQAFERTRQVVAGAHYRVLPVSRRGWVTGSDSLLSSLLAEAGFFNAAGELGIGFGGFASLEGIVNLRPDFIVVSQSGDRADDDGSAFLLHPALERFYPPSRRIVIPDRLTVCGGVMLADALERLMEELERISR
jgi:iron complex transport system substrate-binding protein